MAKKTETRPATSHINPFGLRMQPHLRQRLEESAATFGRSLNAEITFRLEDSFDATSLRAIYNASETATLDDLLEMQRLMVGRHAGEMMYLHNVIRSKLGIYQTRDEEDDDDFQPR